MTNYVECSTCGKSFYYPERLREADQALADALGGQSGQTCDQCSEVIINGSPEQLDALIANKTSEPDDTSPG